MQLRKDGQEHLQPLPPLIVLHSQRHDPWLVHNLRLGPACQTSAFRYVLQRVL